MANGNKIENYYSRQYTVMEYFGKILTPYFCKPWYYYFLIMQIRFFKECVENVNKNKANERNLYLYTKTNFFFQYKITYK